MAPGRGSRQFLDHGPQVLLQELRHLAGLERLCQPIEQLVGTCSRCLALTLVLMGALRALWHVIQVLVIELVQQLMLVSKRDNLIIISALDVAAQKLLGQDNEPVKSAILLAVIVNL